MSEALVPIIPGGMFTDVAENVLRFSQHQEVINLKQNKLNEWETVKGFINANVPSGLTSIKNGVEVSDDLSGDRFFLFQDGVLLYRIDYDSSNSPLTGYENETHSAVTIPAGVLFSIADIAAGTAKFRFFYFRGVIRISGMNEPLWYGYIDKTQYVGASSTIVTQAWVLTKASLVVPSITVDDVFLMWYGNSGPSQVLFIKAFYVYDDTQYSLMTDVTNITSGIPAHIFNIDSEEYHNFGINTVSVRLKVVAPETPDKRISGVAIAYAQIDFTANAAVDEDLLVFYLAEVLPLWEALDPISYTRDKIFYDATFANRLILNNDFVSPNTDKDSGVKEEAYLYVGATIRIIAGALSLTTTITNVTFGNAANLRYIEIADSVHPNLKSVNADGYLNSGDNVGFTITRVWQYVMGTGYETYIGIQLALQVNEFHDFTEMPAGTLHNTPNYKHHVIIEDRPYCLSRETEEEDVVRYGPLLQFDNFPIGNVIQTQVGDVDRNQAIVRRDDRLMILKRNSVSQISFLGNRFREDIGLKDNGLFVTDGFLSIDNTLFWMDKEDIYYFGGVTPRPLLVNQLMRNIYRDNITTASFLARNKIDNELWAVLGNGVILVYSFDRKNWYQRQTSLTLLFSVLDSDKRLIAGSSTRLQLFNHSETTYDETLTWSFTTKIYDQLTPDFFKKAKLLKLLIKGNGAVTVTFQDDVEASSFSEDVTPATTNLEIKRIYPKYLFKRADLKVALKTASVSAQATIGISELQMEKWR